MRQYLTTHPWISFRLDPNRFQTELWIMLGEARSKCEHIASVPLNPEFQKRLHTIYLARGAHATTAIEGNTLSEEEVLGQLEGRSVLPSSMQYLAQENENVIEGYNRIGEQVLAGKSDILRFEQFIEYNKLVLRGLTLEEGVVPGQIPSHPVGVTGARYRGVPREDCEYLLRKLCSWLNEDFPPPDDPNGLIWGIIKAVIAHLYIAWIHPFGDGNGRTARLVEFQVLLACGVPTPAAHLLTNYYNQTRQEYYRRLAVSSQGVHDGGMSFLLYSISGLVEGLRTTLSDIRDYQWNVAWRDYVYDRFKDKHKQADRRMRQLVLDLSEKKEPCPIARLTHLTPKVAQLYAGLTERTIRNDVGRLEQMDLIERSEAGIRARREKILAFLPVRRA